MSHLPPHITITVKNGVDPFGDVLQQARDVFADHQDKEDFFVAERDEGLLNNFHQLKEFGRHPMLPRQTKVVLEENWKNIRMEVEETKDWVMFFARPDNLYIRGFGNQHGAYELVEKRRAKAPKMGEGDVGAVKPVPVKESVTQLPVAYGCVPLHNWDVSYADLLGVDLNEPKPDAKIEDIFQEIVKDPTFAVRAIQKLSNFQHKEEEDGKEDDVVDSEEKEAKLMLGGTIFLLGEHLRMNMHNDNIRYVDKSQGWGEVCCQLLNWRDEDFKEWITQVNGETNASLKLKKLGIDSPEAALKLAHLILNRHVLFQRMVKKDGGGKGTKGGDKGPKGGDKGPKGGDKGKHPKKKNDDESGSDKKEGSRTLSFALGGRSLGADSCGRRRVQILDVQANFSIDWIVFWDWHRPQIIYIKDLLDNEEDYNPDVMTALDLVGPERAISPYGSIGVEFYPTQAQHAQKKQRTSNHRGTLLDVWVVENSNDCDDPTTHKRDIRGERDHQKLTIHYMVIPNAIEARVTAVLVLREDTDGYKLSGSVKAWGSEMNRGVKLFSNQMWNVPGGKSFKIPLMVSKICIDNGIDAQLLGVDLDLQVESRSTGQIDYIHDAGSNTPFKFPKGFTTHKKDYGGHSVVVSVVLRA